MSLKSLGIILLIISIGIILFGNDGASPSNGLSTNLILGIVLAVISIFIIQYNPVEEVKEKISHGISDAAQKSPLLEEEINKKVDATAEKAKKTISEKQLETKQKIRQLAKEVEKLTE